MSPKLPVLPASSGSYAEYLQRRIPARVRMLALCGSGAAAACALVEGVYAVAGRHPESWALGSVAAMRLPVVALGLLWLALARRASPARIVPTTFVATLGSAIAIDWGFFAQGFAGTGRHALLLVMSAVISMQLLPVGRSGRFLFFALLTGAHGALLTLTVGGRDGLEALSFEAMAFVTTVSLAYVLEAHFRSHRRQFELRQQVVEALATLEQSRNRLLAAGGTLSGSSQSLSESARALWRQAEGLHQEVESIATSSERIAASAGDLSVRTRESSTRAQLAHERAGDIDRVVQGLSAGMAEVVRAVERSQAHVRELQVHSSSAQSFVEILRDVADQTHVLSINAGLEAARADQHGLGFAVVAREVRRLSAETNRRTAEVGALMARMERTMQEALEAALSIGETTHRFQPVLDSARRTLSDIRTLVTEQQEDMSASNGQAGQQAQDTAGISEACARLRSLVEGHAHTTADVASTVAELGELAAQLPALMPALRA